MDLGRHCRIRLCIFAHTPLVLGWEGVVAEEAPFYLTEFGALPLSFRSTQARKPTPSVSPTDVGESQNVKLPSGHTLDGLASSFCLGA